MRPEVEPTVTSETWGSEPTDVLSHPAFAQITAHRVEGSPGVLYGSDIDHQRSICISVHRSQLRRGLSNDWHHSDSGALIKMELSEAQWATFVSSLNNGSGVPATLTVFDKQQVPRIKNMRSTVDVFTEEMKNVAKKISKMLRDAAAELDETKPIPKTKVAGLRQLMVRAADHFVLNSVFVSEQFDEHMEKRTERAKAEVNAYVTSMIARAGLDAYVTSMIARAGLAAVQAPATPKRMEIEGEHE